MNKKSILKSLLISAVTAAGLATSAFAGGNEPNTPAAAPAPTAAPSSGTPGLLGQTYAGLTYSYVHLNAAPVNADSYGFEYNQPLNPGFDAVFNYDWTQSGFLAGSRTREQQLAAALRAFTAQGWGTPYIEAGAGYDWVKFAGVKDNSFVWIAGTGVEIQAVPALTITPFVRYEQANGHADNHELNYGVKANYWLSRQVALTGAVSRNDSQDMTYRFGVNIRF
jgi:opacity protein-like surface antigen